MSIQGKVVENHRANEGDLRGLGVHDFVVRVHPETRQFGKDVNNLQPERYLKLRALDFKAHYTNGTHAVSVFQRRRH